MNDQDHDHDETHDATDAPEDNGTSPTALTPQQKYREQIKLQTAITKVVYQLECMKEHQIEMNYHSWVMMMSLLDSINPFFLDNLGERAMEMKDYKVNGYMVELAVKNIRRRYKETEARYRRDDRAQ